MLQRGTTRAPRSHPNTGFVLLVVAGRIGTLILRSPYFRREVTLQIPCDDRAAVRRHRLALIAEVGGAGGGRDRRVQASCILQHIHKVFQGDTRLTEDTLERAGNEVAMQRYRDTQSSLSVSAPEMSPGKLYA